MVCFKAYNAGILWTLTNKRVSDVQILCVTNSSAAILSSTGPCHPREGTLQWRHNEHNGVSNDQSHDCSLRRLFMRRSKKTSKLRVTGLCEGNSPVTGEFPAQRASNAENLPIWWRHHGHKLPILPISILRNYDMCGYVLCFRKLISICIMFEKIIQH